VSELLSDPRLDLLHIFFLRAPDAVFEVKSTLEPIFFESFFYYL